MSNSSGRASGTGWLRSVHTFYVLYAFHIRDGAGNFQNAIVGARGEAQAIHGALQHSLAFRRDIAVFANCRELICALQ